MAQPHERFKAWQACHRLVLAVYALSEGWPVSERFGLTAQARRAAVSAATCLVEGAAKRGRAEFARYTDITVGSLAELGYLLKLAQELGYHQPAAAVDVDRLRTEAARLVGGLARALRRGTTT